MRNNLSHEIGHIYGLRHEFAPKEHSHDEPVRFGPDNSESVMNYNDKHAPIIQETDRIWLQKLYNKNDPVRKLATSRESLPVKRIKPFGDKLKRSQRDALRSSKRDAIRTTNSIQIDAIRRSNSIHRDALRNSIRNNNNK